MLGNIWKAQDSSPWQNNFINGIQIHNQSPWWQFIHPKPNSYWQYQSPILIGNIKAQILLATSKPNSHWQHQSLILIGNIKTQFSFATPKPNSHWQYQSPILIGNIKTQFSLALLYQKEKSPRLSLLGKEKISW